jgi:hypothetical protein
LIKKLVFPNPVSDINQSHDETLEILSKRSGLRNNDTEDLLFQKELSEILRIEPDNLSPVYKTLITLL